MRSFLFLGIPAVLGLVAACGSNVVSQQTGGASTSSTTHTGAGGIASTAASTAATGTGGATSSMFSSATTGSTTASTSSSGTGGGSAHGACQTSADCGGNPCEPITPGGYLVCLTPVAEATSCQFMGPPNQCCT